MIRRIRTRGILQRFGRFLKARILHVSDSPHKIALGVAIGLFVAWTPAMGFHMLLAFAICSAFKANKLAGVACVWISNPFTIIPVYYPSYLVGRAVVGFWRGSPDLGPPQVEVVLRKMASLGNVFTDFHRAEFWRELFDLFFKISVELWIGSLIVGIIVAVAGYFVSYRIIILHRHRNPRRRFTEFR